MARCNSSPTEINAKSAYLELSAGVQSCGWDCPTQEIESMQEKRSRRGYEDPNPNPNPSPKAWFQYCLYPTRFLRRKSRLHYRVVGFVLASFFYCGRNQRLVISCKSLPSERKKKVGRRQRDGERS